MPFLMKLQSFDENRTWEVNYSGLRKDDDDIERKAMTFKVNCHR